MEKNRKEAVESMAIDWVITELSRGHQVPELCYINASGETVCITKKGDTYFAEVDESEKHVFCYRVEDNRTGVVVKSTQTRRMTVNQWRWWVSNFEKNNDYLLSVKLEQIK